MTARLENRIWIVLPVHNRIRTTRLFVDCLERQTFRRFTLLLVDDGSTDGTADHVTSRLPGTEVIRGDGSLWWGGSLDVAYRYLSSRAVPNDLVLIMNDDLEMPDDFLETGWRVMEPVRRTLVQSTCYSKQNRKLLDWGVKVDWAYRSFTMVERPSDVNVLSTRGLFLRMSDWREIGGLYPFLLPHYGSDYEFTIRARRMGFRLLCDERLKVYLDETTTGVQQATDIRLGRYLYDTLLNKRSAANQIYWTTFILLACDKRYIPRNLWRLYRQFLGGVFKRMMSVGAVE